MYMQITEQIIIDIEPVALMLAIGMAALVKIFAAGYGANKAKK